MRSTVSKTEYEAKLALLDRGGASMASAEGELAAARARATLSAAAALSAARAKAARRLEAAVAAELAPLKLGNARFRVTLTPLGEADSGAHGAERVAFEIATLEGAAFGGLAKIASGGELARFALALEGRARRGQPARGARLRRSRPRRRRCGGRRRRRTARSASRPTQVLLVTHSPQVAARAREAFPHRARKGRDQRGRARATPSASKSWRACSRARR